MDRATACFMYRVLAIAILLAAGVSPPRLEGQVHTSPRPGVPARLGVGPRVSVVRPAPGFGVIRGPRPQLGRGASLVGRVPFRHHLGSHTFFGNSWLGEQEELPFEEQAESPSEERAEELTEELIRGTVFLGGCGKSKHHADKHHRPRYSLGRPLKRRRRLRFWCFVTAVGEKSRTMQLWARRFGCSQSGEHIRCLLPISIWKPPRTRTMTVVSSFGSRDGITRV